MSYRTFLIAIALLVTGSAHALTVSFITPQGTVGPNDAIEVWVRLSADEDFNFDSTDPDGDMTYGNLDPGLIPDSGYAGNANGGAGGFVMFDSIQDVTTSTAFSCSGSFAGDDGGVCPPGANYSFDFNINGPSSFFGFADYALTAGDSEDFLFGTFNPLGGGAAPGTYDFFGALLGLNFYGEGYDDLGDLQSINAFVTLASTCSSGDTSCAFSRTVVPVPAAVWLFGSALLGLVSMRRRRSV